MDDSSTGSRSRLLGPYELLDLLGGGSFGFVWKARHRTLKHDVAVKLLRPGRNGPVSLERFHREAKALMKINHPNVVRTLGYDEVQSQGSESIWYLAMELVPGVTLRDLIRRGPIGRLEAIRIAVRIADGLRAVHGAKMAHRDLAPKNILVHLSSPTRLSVKVVDFGLVKSMERSAEPALTAEGSWVGTAHYMAPESFEGAASAASDVWALGVIVLEMLTGTNPFRRATSTEVIAAVLTKEVDVSDERLGTPRLQEAIRQSLAKRAGERLDISEFYSVLVQEEAEIQGDEATEGSSSSSLYGALAEEYDLVADEHELGPTAWGPRVAPALSATKTFSIDAGTGRIGPRVHIPGSRPEIVQAARIWPGQAIRRWHALIPLAAAAAVLVGALAYQKPEGPSDSSGGVELLAEGRSVESGRSFADSAGTSNGASALGLGTASVPDIDASQARGPAEPNPDAGVIDASRAYRKRQPRSGNTKSRLPSREAAARGTLTRKVRLTLGADCPMTLRLTVDGATRCWGACVLDLPVGKRTFEIEYPGLDGPISISRNVGARTSALQLSCSRSDG